MNEDIQTSLNSVREKMKQSISHLDNELARIRAGKANPRMLESVYVDYYGTQTPLSQVANINTPDAKTIAVQPWEKNMIQPIEQAILNSNLGFNPDNNGDVVRISIPVLTEERRKQLVKDANTEGENAKISVRTVRKDANEKIKKLLKDKKISEDMERNIGIDIQELTDNFNKEIDTMIDKKVKEILTV